MSSTQGNINSTFLLSELFFIFFNVRLGYSSDVEKVSEAHHNFMPSQPIMQSEPTTPTRQRLSSVISEPSSLTHRRLSSSNSEPTSPTGQHFSSSISVLPQEPMNAKNTTTPPPDTSKAVKNALSLVNNILQTHDSRIKQKSRF